KAMKLIDAAKKRQQEENAPDDGYLFSMDDEPLLYTSVTTAFVRYCRMMGIARKSSHKARKTFVSTLIDNGVNINTVRQIVGHTDERTTLNNYCYDRSTPGEKLKRIADAFS
ncbi:MAG: tyrosine-type recombinase/integrase, partial [Eubacterium sp.]|nr:tyrosine-type recombinase/integrase [Eubacterium sp.]